jgi:putative ABC transport system permease protein
MLKDYFRLAINNISHRRLRSWLTIIGIVIGIAAVVALISLGQGVKKVITDEFSKMGTDKIIIQPAVDMAFGSGLTPLTEHDMSVIKRVKGVKEVGGIVFTTGKVESKKSLYFLYVLGLPLDETKKLIEETYAFEYIEGRSLKSGDKYRVVIAYDIARGKTLDKPVSVGDKINIEGKDFNIVGVLKQTGDPGFDSAVVIPMEAIRELYDLSAGNDYKIDGIIARTDTSANPDNVAEEIKRSLRRDRNVEEGSEDFSVQTTTQLMESFSIILDTLSAIVIGIAAISLFIGGVGIMNTMYTAVIQRTNEIGVMKAIGAKNSDILQIFLIESGMLGLVGGIIGVAIGIGLSKIIEYIGRVFLGTILLRAYFPAYLIVGALLFAFIIGTLSGVLPAREAAKMKPVDSLRYE